MNLADITPVILTYNEEANIGRCVEKLVWAKEIIILDSGSTDRTKEIADSHPTVLWCHRPFDTHPQQWNAALALVQTKWALTLDADYILSKELIEEIRSLSETKELTGWRIPFTFQIHGKSLRQSLLPPRLALFQKNHGNYVQDGHTQDLLLNGTVGLLKNTIYHDDRKPFSRWWESQKKYADLEVEKLLQAPWLQLSPQDKIRRFIILAPFLVVAYTLLIRGCLWDGKAGWIYVCQRFLAEALLSYKLLIAWFKM